MENRKEKEAEFHDKLRGDELMSKDPDFRFLTSNRRFYSVARKSINFAEGWLSQRCKNKASLDYCCGDGAVAIFLAKNGAKAVGIDISPISIQNSEKRAIEEGVNQSASFFVMDAEKLDFEDNYFDIIVCSGVLHHLNIEKAFQELGRVLKPNGEIICIEPLIYNPIFQLYRIMTPRLRTKYETENILTKKKIDLAKNYFEKTDYRFFHLITLAAVPFRNLKMFNYILGFFEKVDSVLLDIPLVKWLAWQIIFILSRPKNKKDIL